MNWFTLTLISVFIAAFSNILQRVLMKDNKSDPRSYAAVFCLLLGVLNVPFVVLYGFQLPPINVTLVFFFLSAFLWGIGTVLVFKALRLLEASEVTILTSVRALVTIVASLILFQEVFNAQKFLGTVIILGSIFLVMKVKKGIKFNKGVFYAFAGALCNGLAVTFDVLAVKSYDPISYLVIINFLIGGILIMLYPKTIHQWKTFIQPNFLKKMIPLGICSTAQAFAYYFALASGPTSQIAPISQAQVILTVLLAAILLHEKDNLFRKLLAAVLVTIGVILLK